MLRYMSKKVPFILSNIAVMYVLHGNSRQFWPKIPYLSLRNESVPEHCRLLFNTLMMVTLGQVSLGRLPWSRMPARLMTMIILPLMLPLLIAFGKRGLRLQGQHAEVYYISLVPVLTVSAAVLDDGLAKLTVPDEM